MNYQVAPFWNMICLLNSTCSLSEGCLSAIIEFSIFFFMWASVDVTKMISEMFSRFFYLFGYLHVLLTKSLYLASVLPNIWFFTSTWWIYDSVPLQITHDRFGFLLLSWKCYSVQITCDCIFLLTLFGCVF